MTIYSIVGATLWAPLARGAAGTPSAAAMAIVPKSRTTAASLWWRGGWPPPATGVARGRVPVQNRGWGWNHSGSAGCRALHSVMAAEADAVGDSPAGDELRPSEGQDWHRYLRSLASDEEREIAQLRRRFADSFREDADEEDDASTDGAAAGAATGAGRRLSFRFTPTDPEFCFELDDDGAMGLVVRLPPGYPEHATAELRIESHAIEWPLRKALERVWARQCESYKGKPHVRPALRWFDRHLVELLHSLLALREEQRNVRAAKAQGGDKVAAAAQQQPGAAPVADESPMGDKSIEECDGGGSDTGGDTASASTRGGGGGGGSGRAAARNDAGEEVPSWTVRQHQQLEAALRHAALEQVSPSRPVVEHWRRVAASVEGKTAAECISRYLELRRLAREYVDSGALVRATQLVRMESQSSRRSALDEVDSSSDDDGGSEAGAAGPARPGRGQGEIGRDQLGLSAPKPVAGATVAALSPTVPVDVPVPVAGRGRGRGGGRGSSAGSNFGPLGALPSSGGRGRGRGRGAPGSGDLLGLGRVAGASAARKAPSGEAPVPAKTVDVAAGDWTQEQQDALEAALKAYPPTLDKAVRWKSIADSVPGKSKKECVSRVKALRDIAKGELAATRDGGEVSGAAVAKGGAGGDDSGGTSEPVSDDKARDEATGEADEADEEIGTADADKRKAPKISLNPDRRGTQVVFDGLRLHGVGVIWARKLRLLCQCERCDYPFEVALGAEGDVASSGARAVAEGGREMKVGDDDDDVAAPAAYSQWCGKCSIRHDVVLRAEMAHERNSSLGYVDTGNAGVKDLLPSDVSADCLSCNTQITFPRFRCGRQHPSESVCHTCHTRARVVANTFLLTLHDKPAAKASARDGRKKKRPQKTVRALHACRTFAATPTAAKYCVNGDLELLRSPRRSIARTSVFRRCRCVEFGLVQCGVEL